MSHVFVSYKRESLEIVTPLVNELKRHHYVWFDQMGIPGGSDWEEKIKIAIDDAVTVILMVTPAALESEWVQFEYQTAQKKGVTVIPYILEPSTLPDDLRGMQVIKHMDAQSFERLIDALPDVSRIWGEHIVTPEQMRNHGSLGEIAQAFPDGLLQPSAKLVGIPIKQTRYCKVYRIGRHDDTLEPQDSYQLALQLTSRDFSLTQDANGMYPQDNFPSSIASHFMTSPSKHIQMYLIRGPLNQAYDDANRLGFGMNVHRQSEWRDVVESADYARGIATGKTMQLFVNGPAILTYALGTANPGFDRYELYQLDYDTQTYSIVLSN